MKHQITVREVNDWENETFNYVIEVTEEEENTIQTKCELLGQGSLSVKKTSKRNGFKIG